MKKQLVLGLESLLSVFTFLKPAFGQEFGYRPQPRVMVAAQVNVGGSPYAPLWYQDCRYRHRHDCGRHRGWRHRDCDRGYYRHW